MPITKEVIAIFVIDFFLVFFASVAAFYSLKIALFWDKNKSTQRQYALEKTNYLNSNLIKIILFFKAFSFLFFVFTIDSLSEILSGAMCAVGVFNATEVGYFLLVLKIFNLYMLSFWLLIDFLDTRSDMKYSRSKAVFFCVFFVIFILESALDFVMISQIDTKELVSCCSILYSSYASGVLAWFFLLPTWAILLIFYSNLVLIFLSIFLKKPYFFIIFNLLFIFTAIISQILFFGTYIYQLPTHHCPFCVLKPEYYYIGYLLYLLLFLGSFLSLTSGFFKAKKLRIVSFILIIFYSFILNFYLIGYYVSNGVWL